jgi:replication factor C subunit 2/4
MEIYSNTTGFALACNVSTKISEPIQSRAAILCYSRLSDEEILTCLRQVCEMEQLSYIQTLASRLLFSQLQEICAMLSITYMPHSLALDT